MDVLPATSGRRGFQLVQLAAAPLTFTLDISPATILCVPRFLTVADAPEALSIHIPLLIWLIVALSCDSVLPAADPTIPEKNVYANPIIAITINNNNIVATTGSIPFFIVSQYTILIAHIKRFPF
jgi:hypothetical protein